MSSQGRIRGGVAGPPEGPEGMVLLSAMTAFPLGREDHGRPRTRDAPDPVQRVDGGLQCRDVGHADLEHVALAAAAPPAVLDPGTSRMAASRPVSSTESLSITPMSA